jgi:hypothetical protein
LLAVEQPNQAVADLAKKAGRQPLPSRLLLQRYYRPEDISRDLAYRWVVPRVGMGRTKGVVCGGGLGGGGTTKTISRRAGRELLLTRMLLQQVRKPEDISRDKAYRWVGQHHC